MARDRINSRKELREQLDELEGKMKYVERQLGRCTIDEYMVLKRQLNAMHIKSIALTQRLTNVNQYWTNKQSYEPNITIAR